ncbi:MAG: tyrosine-type recombinase/integrase [Janthinobacterium lividum]
MLAKAARWATEKYPDAANAKQWTKCTAKAFVAAVTSMKEGDWVHPKTKPTPNWGKPLSAGYQIDLLAILRLFFTDCHDSESFPISFNPDRYLATPKHIFAKLGPKPRPIAYAQWTKLQEAGLSLTEKDLPIFNLAAVKRSNAIPKSWYPLDMMRAMAIVWLYTGLRANEIRRLRVGCIEPAPGEENEGSSSIPTICDLIVPMGKNGSGYTKPVIGFVGDAIKRWEKTRPSVPKHWDEKTAEAVDFLFVWKGKQLGITYINKTLIPMLCRKAGLPVEDTVGKITSHRARHTLATELANAPTPMSDSDRQRWFGQRSSASPGYYAAVNERKLREAYARANRISVDKRQLEQLKDPNTINGGLVTKGEPIPSVDLGHGFCTYDFYDQCRQQKPCTKCLFYKAKASRYSQVEEVTNQFLSLVQRLPLSGEVRQAVEDAIAAHETLLVYLRTNEENPRADLLGEGPKPGG